MTISIQGASAALTALDNLTTQQPGSVSDTAGVWATTSGSGGSAGPSVISLAGGFDLPSSPTSDLADAASIADAAAAAGTTVQGLLAQLQQQALAAADPSLDGDAFSGLSAGFSQGLAQIQGVVSSAGVAGVNLIDGSLGGPITAGSVTLSPIDLSLGGPLIGVGADASLSDPSTASSLAAQLSLASSNVGQAVGQIAAQSQALNGHLTVVAQAAASLSPSLAGAINGNLDSESAALQALQVQQQLQSSGGSIANQNPLAILALFR